MYSIDFFLKGILISTRVPNSCKLTLHVPLPHTRSTHEQCTTNGFLKGALQFNHCFYQLNCCLSLPNLMMSIKRYWSIIRGIDLLLCHVALVITNYQSNKSFLRRSNYYTKTRTRFSNLKKQKPQQNTYISKSNRNKLN